MAEVCELNVLYQAVVHGAEGKITLCSLGLLHVQSVHLGLLVTMVTVGINQSDQGSVGDSIPLGLWAHYTGMRKGDGFTL